MEGANTNFIPGTKRAPMNLGHVLLLGLGVSGKAVQDYCQALLGGRVASLSILTGNETNGFELAQTNASGHEQTRIFATLNSIQEHFDICIASPGISQFSALYEAAASVSGEIISEVEFAWRESAASARWVAITGTNGKTTTTALCAHVLQEAGLRAAAVGNIGDTCIQAVGSGLVDIYVAEVSSYQLASVKHFAPDIALLLNITPDHLAWHKSFEAYVEAKAHIFDHLQACAGNVAILDASNEEVRKFARRFRETGQCAYIPVGTADGVEGNMRERCGSVNAAFLKDGHSLVVAFDGREALVGEVEQLQIQGEHNITNALMAASAALSLGVAPAAICQGLASFAPLEHRLEPCGVVGGVACYNDSKATNPESCVVALRTFAQKKPIVLLGGDDKGTSLDDLVQVAERSCRAAVCFGAAGPRFAAALDTTLLPHMLAASMEDALDTAFSIAQEGDTILLSPACASFDEFDNFEHRGAVFKQLLATRK